MSLVKFKRVYIEISNICNVQCSFCPVVERDKKAMTPLEFEKTLLQVKPKADEVCLHLMGEPTAHPQFLEILKVCEKHQVLVQITTNGLLINRYKEDILKSPFVRQINFSVQSFFDNFPHKNFEDYLETILNFCKMAGEQAPAMYQNLRLWNIKDNGDAIDDNEKVFSFVEKYFNVEIKREIDVASIKSKKIINRLYLHFDSRFRWPELGDEIISVTGRCHGLISHVGIHANGDVVPCCLDKESVLKLGNINQSTFEDILNSKRARDIREGFQNNKLIEDLCQRCEYIQRFK